MFFFHPDWTIPANPSKDHGNPQGHSYMSTLQTARLRILQPLPATSNELRKDSWVGPMGLCMPITVRSKTRRAPQGDLNTVPTHTSVKWTDGVWNNRDYYTQTHEFLLNLAALIIYTAALHMRGPELTKAKHANDTSTLRNILIHLNHLLILTEYYKGDAIKSRPMVIARYLPEDVGRLVLSYLSEVIPFIRLSAVLQSGNEDVLLVRSVGSDMLEIARSSWLDLVARSGFFFSVFMFVFRVYSLAKDERFSQVCFSRVKWCDLGNRCYCYDIAVVVNIDIEKRFGIM
ncbi:hypothetical protein FQN53_009759 [Emmonsiellopsis sp. PD_33]|nr:hypothetical protein FQN53_009759 [Emmonsiellopsis sp. PD_33]